MKIDKTILTKALDWSYDKALTGTGPFISAYAVANDYLSKAGSSEKAINSLIQRQVVTCASSGFITGLGGLITLPLAIPANISTVLLTQLRMVMAIAIIGGFDPRKDQVRSLCFACLTGRNATGILHEVGISTVRGVAESAVRNISEQVSSRIDQLVKVRLLTQTGRIGFIKMGKVIPLVGGVIGGAIDASSTKAIGAAARQVFALREW